MKKNAEKTKTGWLIPINIKDLFVNFCAEMGNIAQEDCAGALLIWQYLPAQIREAARLEAKGAQKANKEFWENFRKSVQKTQPLSDDQIEKFWTQMERIGKKVGVKLNKPKQK